MLVDGSLGTLIQGVSQQPNRERAPGQCEEQINAIADVVDGLKRRPPLEFISVLGAPTANDVWYDYNSGTEQYVIRFYTGGVNVWRLDGSPVVVNAPSTFYLDNCSPDDISATTIGDYTVVTSKSAVPAMDSVVAVDVHGALLHFSAAGETNQTFEVWIDNFKYASFDGPGINDPSIPAGGFSVNYAVTQLYTQLQASGASAVYDFSILDSTILVQRKTGLQPIIARVSDGHTENTSSWVIQDTIRKSSWLPPKGLPGMVVTVTGEGDSEGNDVYLRFETDEGQPVAFGSPGVWRECPKPGLFTNLNAYTMPHVLVRLPDASFYFGPLDGSTQGGYQLESWRTRDSGNDDTVPVPGFIGKGITAVGTFQERMWLTSEDVVDFSATNSYFNFFNDTAVTVTSADPIQLRSSDSQITELTYGMTHNKHLVFFTEFSQYLIKGNQALTPENAHMPKTSAFETALDCAPVSGGNVIFFPITYGAYGGVQEFYTEGAANIDDARAITEHVKRYVDGYVSQMLASPSLGMLLCRASGAPKSLFIYQDLWQNGQRAQAAWSRWNFDGNVTHIFWKGTDLYVCLERNNAVYLHKIDLTDKPVNGLDFNVYLDSLAEVTPTGDIIVLPYSGITADQLAVVQGPGCKYPGMSYKIKSVVGPTVTLDGEPEGSVFIGIKYLTDYQPSMPKITDYKDRVISTDDLKISKFLITFKETGKFNVVVSHPYYDDATFNFTGRVIGAAGNFVGVQPISTGIFKAGIGRDAAKCGVSINTDSYLPMTLSSIEWQGLYNKRGRRM